MATTAQYTAQPILEYAQVTSVETSRTAPTGAVEITAGPNVTAGVGVGKRITRITCQAATDTIAGTLRFFLSTDGGTTRRLILEKPKPTVTVGVTVSGFRVEATELAGMILPGGTANKLYCANGNNTETWNITVESALL